MTTTRIALDGLWQCLCPSFRPTNLLRPSRNLSKPLRFRPRRPSTTCVQARSLHGSQARRNQLESTVATYVPLVKAEDPFQTIETPENARSHAMDLSDGLARPRQNDWTDELARESTPMLYELLRTAASYGDGEEVHRIARHLVLERHEAPNARLFAALILANIDVTEGSIFRVERLLQEMADENIQADVRVCHDVLKVTAVHPDYILRARILDHMRQRWMNITESGHHDVVAGLIREGQMELADERLTQMRKEGVRIQEWLHDMYMYALIECREIDEALQVLRERLSSGRTNISKDLWHALLDTASASFHYAATAYIWNSQVAPGYLNPSSGICSNVLTTAARAGDVVLASEVFRTLGQRAAVFSTLHYGDLLQAYLNADPPDLRASLSVLTIMAGANLDPTATSTRPLFLYIQNDPKLVSEALEMLKTLHRQGRAIPIAALNVLIEAFVEQKQFDKAFVLYKSMHTFAPPEKPNEPFKPFATVETFNHLLRGARQSANSIYDTAMFLASEQLALGIKPDNLTYDRLVSVCIESARLVDGWRYFDEADNLGLALRPNTVSILATALASAGDDKCWDVLQRIQADIGDHYKTIRQQVETSWAASGKTMAERVSPQNEPSVSAAAA